MAAETLLEMFPPVPTEQWERMIRETVPGPDYAAKLIWHPEEGLAIRPYYRAEDLAGLGFLDACPGEFPYVRGTRSCGGWRIREEIDSVDPEDANHHAIAAVAAGAEEISFGCARIEHESDLALLLAHLDEIPIHIDDANNNTVRLLLDRLDKRPHPAGISANVDPLADVEFSAETLRRLPPGCRPFLFNAGNLHEKAAGAIEEVGFTLSAAVDFLAEMRDRGIETDRAADAIHFRFAMGPEFFIQIAKLRAFRMAWAQVLESFGGSREHAQAVIHACPCCWDKTIYDRHVNALRSTTEAISAIFGGADSISIAPFDACCGTSDDSSRRLARNTQIILKHEALLDRVADPLGGSYLIEVLTNSIATKAWRLMQELETAGGYRKARETGIIASVLEHRLQVRQDAASTRRRVLTGTNRFADVTEKAPDFHEELQPGAGPRVASAFEHLRLSTERHASVGHLPLIVLAEIGDVKMRSARSQFAADFLACAGLRSEARQFETADQIVASEADLIVLCSSDPEYLPIAEALMPALRNRESSVKVVIAGNPETSQQLRDLGVVEFMHLRSDAIAVLASIQRQLGIKE